MKKQLLAISCIAIISILALIIGKNGLSPKAGSLGQREQQVWAALEALGVNKEKFNALCKQSCVNTRTDKGSRTAKAALCQLTESVLTEFGLPAEQFSILKTSDRTIARATNNKVEINEHNFEQFPTDAQRFIIAHETQHILNHDETSKRVLDTLLREQGISDRQLCKPRNDFYQFIEERADIQAARTNSAYSQGYVSFMQTLLNRYGEHSGTSHPKNADRLQLAQQINSQTRGTFA